ncbi:MAG: flagellar motor switch protein FliN [Planctomycetaceae bacterium]|nr:flagellar motor switch protein FliN [Planctomycetaceae bacterium]
MGSDDDLLDPNDIEALLNQAGAAGPASDETPEPEAAAPDATGGPDLLDPSDIESLLNQGPATEGVPSPGGPDLLDPSDIASLLGQGAGASITPPPPAVGGAAERLISQAEADLAAAIAPDFGSGPGMTRDVTGASPLTLDDLALSASSGDRSGLSMLQDVELDLRIELGRTELMIEEVVALSAGSVVPLDKLAGDPVDILVNGRLIARGEVLILNDNFCVRVAEILTPQDLQK